MSVSTVVNSYLSDVSLGCPTIQMIVPRNTGHFLKSHKSLTMSKFAWCGKCGKMIGLSADGFCDACRTNALPGQLSYLEETGMEKLIDEWSGCYPSNWKGMIVEEAFAHPAKYSNKLIRKIYDHIAKEGWVEPGDCVVDPALFRNVVIYLSDQFVRI